MTDFSKLGIVPQWAERATAPERGRLHMDLTWSLMGEGSHDEYWSEGTTAGLSLVSEVMADLLAYALENGASLPDMLARLSQQDAVYEDYRRMEGASVADATV